MSVANSWREQQPSDWVILKDARTAEAAGHPFHGNQYTKGRAVKEDPFDPDDPDNPANWPPMDMYHGTVSSALKSIKEKGLVPMGGKGADDAVQIFQKYRVGDRAASVYVADDPTLAHEFAELAARVNPGAKPVVLEVEIPANVADKLVPDEQALSDEALMMGRENPLFRYKGTIPPEWINVVEYDRYESPDPWGNYHQGMEQIGRWPIKKYKAASARKFYLVLLVKEDEPTTLRKHPENEVHAAADEHLEPLINLVNKSLEQARSSVNWPTLRRAIAAQDLALAERAVSATPGVLRTSFAKALPDLFHKIVLAGGDAGFTILKRRLRAAELHALKAKPKIELAYAFDADNADALEWAREHATRLAKELSDTTRQEIAEALVDAFEGGTLDGLEDRITRAVGDAERGNLIARTEAMTAANEGQRQSWQQAIDRGLLDTTSRRVWIATDVGACPICEALDGKTATLDGEYPSPGGNGPPQHPNCRCTEGITA